MIGGMATGGGGTAAAPESSGVTAEARRRSLHATALGPNLGSARTDHRGHALAATRPSSKVTIGPSFPTVRKRPRASVVSARACASATSRTSTNVA